MSASCFSFLFRATTRSILIHFRVKTLILARLQRKNARTALIEKIKANEENEKIPVSPQYLKQGTFFYLNLPLCPNDFPTKFTNHYFEGIDIGVIV